MRVTPKQPRHAPTKQRQRVLCMHCAAWVAAACVTRTQQGTYFGRSGAVQATLATATASITGAGQGLRARGASLEKIAVCSGTQAWPMTGLQRQAPCITATRSKLQLPAVAKGKGSVRLYTATDIASQFRRRHASKDLAHAPRCKKLHSSTCAAQQALQSTGRATQWPRPAPALVVASAHVARPRTPRVCGAASCQLPAGMGCRRACS